MRRTLVLWCCVTAGTAILAHAQDESAVRARAAAESVFARARRLVVGGNGAAGRVLVDSVVAATSPAVPEYAAALYWRAALASTTADAERDYRRIVVDYPLSERAGDALLQLSHIEVARGERAAAAAHLQRFLLENPGRPDRGRAGYLLARALLEQNELARGCGALTRARDEIPADSIELRNQLEYFAPRCAGVDTSRAPATPSGGAPKREEVKATAAAKSSPPEGRYTLQVAAYPTRAAAESLVKRLKARGFEPRIVGDAKPFRVRIGSYKTRADATAANKRLSARGLKAIVTETSDER